MLGLILAIVIFGFLAGLIARALVPGNDSMSLGATTLLGIAGSFVGGLLGYLLFHHDGQNGLFQPSGIIGSIIGAVVLLLIMRSRTAHSM